MLHTSDEIVYWYSIIIMKSTFKVESVKSVQRKEVGHLYCDYNYANDIKHQFINSIKLGSFLSTLDRG